MAVSISGQNKVWQRPFKFGATANTSLALGGGTPSAPVETAVADKSFVSWFTKSTATSGDSRGQYMRHYVSGAGGNGEALRAFTTVEAATPTSAHGAHMSLSFGTNGAIAGEGAAARATLQIKNGAMTGTGTASSLLSEIWSDGSSSDPAAMTELAFVRVVNSGDGTGVGKVDDKAFFLSFSGGAIGAGNMVAVKTAAAVSHTIRCKAPDGSTFYLMASTNQ